MGCARNQIASANETDAPNPAIAPPWRVMTQTHGCHRMMIDTSERRDSASDRTSAVTVFLYFAISVVAAYLLTFVALMFVPGFGNWLRSIGVSEDMLTKVFYPLLYLIR